MTHDPRQTESNGRPEGEYRYEEPDQGSSILDEVIRATEESDSLVVIDVFRTLAPQYPDLPIEDVGALEALMRTLLERLYPNLAFPSGLAPWLADRVREDQSAMNRIANLWEQATV